MVFPSRKATRIPGFDYSSENYYFVTICTHEKQCIFGKAGILNHWGELAKKESQRIPEHFSGVCVEPYIVMPNHIHMIVALNDANCVSLNNVVGLYKSGVTRKIHKEQPGFTVWQRSFHDHIIRNQREYEKIWQYITYNDQKWTEDCYYQETE